MKSLKLLCLIVFSSLLFCCSSEEEEGQQGESLPDSYFSHNGDVHETPRAYLVYSSVLQYNGETKMDETKYRDRIQLLFLDGAAVLDDDGTRVYSENTTVLTSLSLRDLNGGVVVEQPADVNLLQNEYVLSPGTTVVTSGNVVVNFTQGVTNYGELNGYYLPLTNEDEANIEILSLTIDHDQLSGYIEAEYSISPGIDGSIYGTYKGSFEIIK